MKQKISGFGFSKDQLINKANFSRKVTLEVTTDSEKIMVRKGENEKCIRRGEKGRK